jgi:thiol-disulfide isomerase/thioredoxin
MNNTIRNSLLVIIVATIAGIAGYYTSLPEPAPQPAQPATSAEAAARLLGLKLPDLDGKDQALAQWQGKVLVLNFWATWCPPCRAEIPEFARISVKNTGNGVQFIGISMDSAEKVREFKRETDIPYPLLIGSYETFDLVADLGNRAKGLPFTIIYRRDGSVQQVKLGALPGPELEKALAEALQDR